MNQCVELAQGNGWFRIEGRKVREDGIVLGHLGQEYMVSISRYEARPLDGIKGFHVV